MLSSLHLIRISLMHSHKIGTERSYNLLFIYINSASSSDPGIVCLHLDVEISELENESNVAKFASGFKRGTSGHLCYVATSISRLGPPCWPREARVLARVVFIFIVFRETVTFSTRIPFFTVVLPRGAGFSSVVSRASSGRTRACARRGHGADLTSVKIKPSTTEGAPH